MSKHIYDVFRTENRAAGHTDHVGHVTAGSPDEALAEAQAEFSCRPTSHLHVSLFIGLCDEDGTLTLPSGREVIVTSIGIDPSDYDAETVAEFDCVARVELADGTVIA